MPARVTCGHESEPKESAPRMGLWKRLCKLFGPDNTKRKREFLLYLFNATPIKTETTKENPSDVIFNSHFYAQVFKNPAAEINLSVDDGRKFTWCLNNSDTDRSRYKRFVCPEYWSLSDAPYDPVREVKKIELRLGVRLRSGSEINAFFALPREFLLWYNDRGEIRRPLTDLPESEWTPERCADRIRELDLLGDFADWAGTDHADLVETIPEEGKDQDCRRDSMLTKAASSGRLKNETKIMQRLRDKGDTYESIAKAFGGTITSEAVRKRLARAKKQE